MIAGRSKLVIAALLLVVMPLTIAAITAFGMLALGLPLSAALLLGAVLAPTDPVLAGDVGLGPPGAEDQGEPRLSLHTEAGINDGLASPFVIVGLFVATRAGTSWLGEWRLRDVLYAVGVALLIGVAAGWLIAVAIAAYARDVSCLRISTGSSRRPRRCSFTVPRKRSAATGCSRCSRPASRFAATSSSMRSTPAFITALRSPDVCSSSPCCYYSARCSQPPGLASPASLGGCSPP